MRFEYLCQPPKRFTFEQPKLKAWTETWCHRRIPAGKVLNLFAGKTRLYAPEIRVDADPNMDADYYMDAYDFIYSWKNEPFDTILLDPPYNVRKSREKYNVSGDTFYIGKLTKIKNLLPSIIKKGGIVISYGYDTVGMSASRGFEKIEICLVCHGGDHNDTICLVEKRT